MLSASAFIPLLVAFYVIAGLTLVLTDYTLNDEGVLTYYWGAWARQAFIPVFFFQRVRPVLAALYLPVSAGGLHVTLMAHVATAALAIPMIAAVARALGQRSANLPALVMALSPLYFYGGAAGLSNTDGVVGISLVLYLLCVSHRPLLAGVIAGVLPWVRNELALFSAVLAVHGLLVRRDRALVVGLGSFPLVYAVTGAVYHHDPIWFFHFQPKTPADPTYTLWAGQLIGLQYLLEPLLAVTPIVPVIMAIRLRRLQPIEWTLILYSATAALALNVLPVFHIGNFGTMPRLSMALLPVLALLVGRAAELWWDDERPALTTLALMMALTLWLATRQKSGNATAVLMLGNLMLITTMGLRAGPAAVGLAVAIVAAGPLLPIRLEVSRRETASYLDPMVDWLRAHRDLLSGPVLTNSQLLSAYAERRLAGTDVRFVIPVEMSRDLVLLSNPANGQRERIRRLSETDLYGRTVWGPITPDDVPFGALMALQVDARLPLLLPEEAWRGRLEIIEATPQFEIARVLPARTAVPRS
jgi:hypothetical protein